MRRRGFLTWSAVGLAASCGDDRDAPTPAASTCSPEGLAALTTEILETDRAQLIDIVAAHLAAGRTVEDLSQAAFDAGLMASSFTTHSNHPVKAVAAAREIALATPGPDGYVALLWAIDAVSPTPGGIRNPRDTGVPVVALADDDLPAGNVARAELDAAMVSYDHERAERAIVSLYRERGADEVLEALGAWAGRNVVPNGHYAIAAAQYVRMLETRSWGCAELALRHIVYALTTSPEEANASVWSAGEVAFLENRERLTTIPSTWTEGTVATAPRSRCSPCCEPARTKRRRPRWLSS